MAQKSNYSKLAQMAASERMRASQQPGMLSGLTPTQIAELFPDYFRRGTPDVGGFREAISKASAERTTLWQKGVNERLKSEGSWLEKMRDKYSGGYVGDGGPAAKMNVNQSQMAKDIYNYLTKEKGVSRVHALGILANMKGESAFNPGNQPSEATMRKEGGPSGGLFQHHDNYSRGEHRFTDMVRAAGGEGKWRTNWKGQIDFALTEPDMKKYLSRKFDNEQDAVRSFISDFERPANPERDAAIRIGALSGLRNVVDSTDTGATPEQRKGETTKQQTGGQTPSAGGGGSTQQPEASTSFKVVSGFVVPQDSKLYDTRNAQQCATLGKAFNPNIGRSGGWTVVDGDIKPGQVVATKQYNNSGGDKEHAGYHTGVALTAPNQEGKFLLLEQFNGQPARTRWVDKNAYPIPGGGTTSFGLISSGGKVHTEISQEALSYGRNVAKDSEKQVIGTATGTPGVSGQSDDMGELAPVPQTPEEQLTAAMNQQSPIEGQPQSASVVGPAGAGPNLMGAMMGMMGMMGGQSASPLGLITTAMGFIMPLIGSLGAGKGQGEGIGGGRGGRGRRGGGGGGSSTRTPVDPEMRKAKSELDAANSDVGRQFFIQALNDAGIKDSNIRNIMAANAKGEGEYRIKSESSYAGTSPERIKKTFANAKRLTPAQINAIKTDDKAFFNQMYGTGSKARELGNVNPDDGFNFRGRGQIQITGRANYEKYSKLAGLGDKLVQNPDLLSTDPDVAAKVSVAFMKDKLENYPGKTPFDRITKGVNAQAETVGRKKGLLPGIAKSDEASPSAPLDLQGASQRFASAQQRIAQLKAGSTETQVAATEPTTTATQVGPGATPPTTVPTQVAQAQMGPSFIERAKAYAGEAYTGAKAQVGRLAASVLPQTSERSVAQPSIDYSRTTPGSMDLSRQSAPPTSATTGISETAARMGISQTPPTMPLSPLTTPKYANVPTPPTRPASLDMNTSIQYAPPVMPSATPMTTPKSNAAPSTPGVPPPVTPMKGVMMQAPGPAPDVSAAATQVKQTTAISAALASAPGAPSSQSPVVQQVSQGINHDHTMKQIAKPADNPSMFRAFARAYGNETPGNFGESHFNYGNSG